VDLNHEIATTTPRATAARTRQQRWERGFLLKHLLKGKFTKLSEDADTAEAQLAEYQEQLALARLAAEITVEPAIATSYSQLCDAFAALTQSKSIWDTLTKKATDRAAERTAATEAITRSLVTFHRGQSDILKCEWTVPCLQNRSGGDMYLYPAFVLYRVTADAFAVIDVQDVEIDFVSTQFIETDTIPADSPTVGQTWTKVNKDGSPDKRFKGNVQIPVVQYGTLKLKSKTGLNEQYLISNAPLAQQFAKAWAGFKKSFTVSPKVN
jgi:hypothetical protein